MKTPSPKYLAVAALLGIIAAIVADFFYPAPSWPNRLLFLAIFGGGLLMSGVKPTASR